MKKVAYYNENEPYAGQWLKNLIAAKHIAPGDVDTRSIVDVAADDLKNYTQCHFFAGIGAWSYALKLAGWADESPVWTGSCPCQPFSSAGKKHGFTDERHLWPVWYRLIQECRPSVIFGEQVATAITHGWLDLIQTDLEDSDYAVGAAVLPAASCGAPQERHRLWFVANAIIQCKREYAEGFSARQLEFSGNCAVNESCRMGDVPCERCAKAREFSARPAQRLTDASATDWVNPLHRFWEKADYLYCKDEKWRAVESGTFPLGDGVSNRVGRLRAYGNAIVPQVAATFIKAYMECQP